MRTKRGSKHGTMRFRIAKRVMILLLVLFVVLWGVMTERTLRGLNGSIDELLHSMIEYLGQDMVSELNAGQVTPDTKSLLAGWTPGVEEFFLEVRSVDDGRILTHSSSLKDGESLLADRSFAETLEAADSDGWNAVVDGDRVRCFAARVPWPDSQANAQDGKVLFVAAVERYEADKRFKEIMKRSAMGLGIALFFAVAGVWVVVSRTMRPLDNLTSEIAAVTPDNIRTVHVPEDPQLALLAQRLNRSLEAVRLSLEREKQFSSDVAHELLTPIGGLRAQMEVALLRPRSAEELTEVIQNCHNIVQDIQNLVDDLLQLGRVEKGSAPLSWENIHLADSVTAAWNSLQPHSPWKNVVFENHIAPHVCARADRHLFDLVLRNLLSNVLRYTPAGHRAWTETEEKNGSIILRILNEAGKVPEHLENRAFDRFWRGDPARTHRNATAGTGVGLGLSLARSAACALGCKLDLEIRQGAIVCLRLCLLPSK